MHLIYEKFERLLGEEPKYADGVGREWRGEWRVRSGVTGWGESRMR